MNNSVRSLFVGTFTALSVAGAHADSLSDRLAAKKPQQQAVELEVACGKPDKENCAIVVPAINERTVSQNIRLKPLEGKGSVESMEAICAGVVDAAVVQADVFYSRSQKTDCTGLVSRVGSPLYPYLGFAIVRADAPQDTFDKMVSALPQGGVLHVAAGGSGSGGEATLRMMLASNPEWKQSVDIQPDSADTGLNKLRDRQIDVLFVMDGPQSPLLQTIRDTVDPKTKKPVFKFLDMTPGSRLLGINLDKSQKLYATLPVAEGFWWNTNTIATPAVLVVREEFYRNNAAVVNRIRSAAEDALPVIASKSGAKPGWNRDFAPN